MAELTIITFSDLSIWDVKNYFRHQDTFNESYPLVLFGEFLNKPIIKKTKIEDSNEYRILGVRSYGKGAYINRTVKGNTLKMRTYQIAPKDHLFWCKVDTKNGAFGIIDEKLENAVASSNMTFAEIDKAKANTEYVQLLFTSPKVNQYMDGYVTGTTNRRYIKPNQLLEEIRIPLPPLPEQNRIVSTYDQKNQLAKQQEQEAKNLEQEIEDYLMKKLDLKKLDVKENVKGLQLISFKNIDRWDILAKDMRILNGLTTSRFPLKKIGDVFSFAKRSWNKKKYNKETFRYIELGAIDTIEGITEIKEILTNKAPSRATQQVVEGDLLIGTTRPYLKRFVIIDHRYDGDICSSGFTVLESNQHTELAFLKEFLMSYYGLEQLKNRMTGATYPAITTSELKEILVPFPPRFVQIEIASEINKMRRKIKNLQNEAKQNREEALLNFEQEIFNS